MVLDFEFLDFLRLHPNENLKLHHFAKLVQNDRVCRY